MPVDSALNSASVLDLENALCFFTQNITKLLPENVQYPVVDLRSTKNPPYQIQLTCLSIGASESCYSFEIPAYPVGCLKMRLLRTKH